MDLRKFALVAAMLSISTGLLAADSSFWGTWKQNNAKSKITRGEPEPSRIIVLAPYQGDQGWTRVTLTLNKQGAWVEEHYSALFDGKDYPSLGNDPRLVFLKRVNANAVEVNFKRNGKVTTNSRVEVSKDGKTLTQTASGISGDGQRYENDIRVYDRQ